MIYFAPTIIVLLIQVYLLISWWNARKNKDGKEGKFVFWGFLVGQIYLIWEVLLVQQTGQPLPDSPEQQMLMLRLTCGGAPGGLFVIIGLFYLSFAAFGVRKGEQNDTH
ncbi:hypothetical protein [Candidatus Leptofilum sp.]|uniref:hypothetical protein n=1 Tax=Candidatus Leptofilum sp. TaxID=3241576 RepID=UPI003B5BC769